MKKTLLTLIAVAPALVVACSSSTDPGTSGATGGSASGGASTSGGSTAMGGSSGGTVSSSSGGTAAGGVLGTSGGSSGNSGSAGTTVASGGSTQPGAGGASAGSSGGGAAGNPSGGRQGGGAGQGGAGGAVTGGTGGSGAAGAGGNTTGPGDAMASPGCQKGSARPANGKVYVEAKYHIMFPASYDGKKPFPVVLGFHGCGASNYGDANTTEWQSYTKNTKLGDGYIIAAALSADAQGKCFNYGNDVPRAKAMFDDLSNNYCIDLNHVFATGHSSGAQLTTDLTKTSNKADLEALHIKAVAPIAATNPGSTVSIPILYIQGKMDKERGSGDGHEIVQVYTKANGCQTDTTPYSSVMQCKSQDGGGNVDPGCVQYGGCTKPTIWCSHNDSFYSGTMHGIPCFAMQAMYDFFQSIP